jgi:hypothetical protein
MTLGAIQPGMCANQRKPRGAGVIESAQPTVNAVTGFTPGREACGRMVRIFCGTIIFDMTGRAFGAESAKYAGGRAFVATLALNRSMRAPEWKSIHMAICFLLDLLPPLNAVALLAIVSVQTTMDVRMTVCASHPDIREDKSGVARSTTQLGMLPLKRIASGAVVEIRRRTNWFPAFCRMTVLACQLNCAVRAVNRL